MQSNSSSLPSVIPLTDNDHAVLTVQFALDPGKQIEWGRDENNPNILNTLELTESEKLVLLREYLDVVQVPLPACFLDPAAIQSSEGDPVVSPDSTDFTDLRDCEVSSQNSQTDKILNLDNSSSHFHYWSWWPPPPPIISDRSEKERPEEQSGRKISINTSVWTWLYRVRDIS